MKKLMIVAALLATVAGVAPVSAATMAAPAKMTGAMCFFMPMAPDCVDMMKAKMPPPPAKMAMTMPKMAVPAMPVMPMMPTCVRAPAGAGHLFDCK
jgi:hypothetical protein